MQKKSLDGGVKKYLQYVFLHTAIGNTIYFNRNTIKNNLIIAYKSKKGLCEGK